MTLSLTKHVASALSLSAKRAIQTANSKLSLKNNSAHALTNMMMIILMKMWTTNKQDECKINSK